MPTWKVVPRKDYASLNNVGLNPSAEKIFFSFKIKFKCTFVSFVILFTIHVSMRQVCTLHSTKNYFFKIRNHRSGQSYKHEII